MKVTKFSLYEEMNPQIATYYSRFKLGDRKVISKFAKQLVNIIKKQSKQYGNYAIYATNKYPMNQFCKKSSFLLAEQVAKILRRPLIAGLYKYHYEKRLFSDNSIYKRMVNGLPVIKKKKLLKKLNYHVVMIDDAIFSGQSLDVSLKELKNITNAVSFFSLIKLNRRGYSEAQVNDFLITHANKINELIKIIKQRGYFFTSHAVRTIDELTFNEKQRLMAKIDSNKLSKLKKASKIYFGERG